MLSYANLWCRDPACVKVEYNLQELSDHLDTTIVITYYNEPMSTLLRSLHSVLNFTPPPLVREIILVDDSSNNTALVPGSELDEYLPYLPKVRLVGVMDELYCTVATIPECTLFENSCSTTHISVISCRERLVKFTCA